jgi:hypothetical protein
MRPDATSPYCVVSKEKSRSTSHQAHMEHGKDCERGVQDNGDLAHVQKGGSCRIIGKKAEHAIKSKNDRH